MGPPCETNKAVSPRSLAMTACPPHPRRHFVERFTSGEAWIAHPYGPKQTPSAADSGAGCRTSQRTVRSSVMTPQRAVKRTSTKHSINWRPAPSVSPVNPPILLLHRHVHALARQTLRDRNSAIPVCIEAAQARFGSVCGQAAFGTTQSLISAISSCVKSRFAAPATPCACRALRTPTIAPVTAGFVKVQAIATSPGLAP